MLESIKGEGKGADAILITRIAGGRNADLVPVLLVSFQRIPAFCSGNCRVPNTVQYSKWFWDTGDQKSNPR